MSNQFHYYRLSKDNCILWGGHDAIYHSAGRVRPDYEDRDVTYRRLASHFTTFRNWKMSGSPTRGPV